MKQVVWEIYLTVMSITQIGVAFQKNVCNFENLPAKTLCDGWYVDDATNVIYDVTSDHRTQGIAIRSPTGDHFLSITHSGVEKDGGLILLIALDNQLASNQLILTFDYFIKTAAASSKTNIQVFCTASNELITFINEPTTNRWLQSESAVIVLQYVGSAIELDITVSVEGSDVIAIDNVKLLDVIDHSQATTTEKTMDKTSQYWITQTLASTLAFPDSSIFTAGQSRLPVKITDTTNFPIPITHVSLELSVKDKTDTLATETQPQLSTRRVNGRKTTVESWTEEQTVTDTETPTDPIVSETKEAKIESTTPFENLQPWANRGISVNLDNCYCHCKKASFL